ncbi:SHOCT domain-containing protein [Natrinema zhouii]|uniref:SHOCT domain-containing protein n=1 Tax=Natrinema zhouii TaxID=1710539 RepID=A0A7D6GQN0_9EURY|nr:SHOCT domain-containing protein [Natrinema zhouii]QLK26741.1 SHOCT domain-containing protein [Natrinema zhouii]
MVSRHWLYFGGFVITGILLVGVGLVGILDALSVLAEGVSYSEEFVLLAMLGEAAEWVVIGLALGLFAVVFLVAAVVSVLRSASLPRDDRLVSIVTWLERKYPLLRRFDVTERVEPTIEDRKRQLKERYVAGEISEEAFERELAQLMDDTSADSNSRSGNETAVEIEDQSQ